MITVSLGSSYALFNVHLFDLLLPCHRGKVITLDREVSKMSICRLEGMLKCLSVGRSNSFGGRIKIARDSGSSFSCVFEWIWLLECLSVQQNRFFPLLWLIFDTSKRLDESMIV